jgi:hypothetical protein
MNVLLTTNETHLKQLNSVVYLYEVVVATKGKKGKKTKHRPVVVNGTAAIFFTEQDAESFISLHPYNEGMVVVPMAILGIVGDYPTALVQLEVSPMDYAIETQ